MLKRGDKVIIVGSSCVRDFTEAIVIGTGIEGLPTLVQFKKDGCTHFIEDKYLRKIYLEGNMLNINELIKQALKSHNKTELLVYQAIKAEILNYKTAKNAKPYDEAAEISILKKMVKQREDSEKQYLEAGREDLATKEHNESEVIKKLLPEPVNESEIRSELYIWAGNTKLIEMYLTEKGVYQFDAIEVSKPFIPKKEMGNAIKYLKSKFPQADGKIIADIVIKYVI